MKSLYKSAVISFCAATMIIGCGPKEVEFEGTPNQQQNQQNQQAQTTVDNNVANVAGQETAVESDQDNVITSNIDEESTNMANIMQSGINAVQSDVEGNVVVLKSVHFAFDKFNLTDEMRQIATTNASKISQTSSSYPNLKIKLEGNCDEWGTDEYNYALGLKRAKTAKDALIADGVSEEKIVMVSFGESNPVCQERNVACWKLNRRVDYRLLP